MSLLELPPWKVDFLQSLDWRLFETLCAKVFEKAGYEARCLDQGPDGEINLQLLVGNTATSSVAVKCRKQKDPVTEDQVSRFIGVIEEAGAKQAIFVASGEFEEEVREKFQNRADLRLIDGKQFIEGMQDLGRDTAEGFMKFILGQPEWSIPSCPDCDEKMMRRVDREAKTAHWGCDTEECEATMPIG